jgi:uncharacterized protein (TIGR02117 family)
MARRRKRKSGFGKRIALAILAVPLLYLFAALTGTLVPVNKSWREPDEGITIYLADNGVHADLILPVKVNGLDWRPLLPLSDFGGVPAGANWIAFGAGERRVYLDTPTWGDITPRTLWAATTGGERVMHVEWTSDPAYAARELRVTPEQYRRLWAAIRAGFMLDHSGKPIRIDHPGYGPRDAFYEGFGRASAIDTCNQWVASRLRLAGVKAPAWSPFAEGLVRYYRESERVPN